MRERITAILTWIRERWTNTTRRMRLLFLGGTAVILAAALIMVLLYNRKDYVVLYNDLTSTQNAEVMAALQSASIPFEVDNGRLLVDSKNEGKARLQLATLGFQNTGFKYDIMNQGGLTATQQDKDRNYINNMQERLQATIVEFFPEVSAAVVTVSIPQRSAFALQTNESPASASIMIQRKAGYNLTPEQVRGIVNLVKDSLQGQGLTYENITIADERGDLKSILDLNDDYNNKKLKLTEEVNSQLGKAIKLMVEGPYGADRIRVAVMTTLNTDSKVSESKSYLPLDPENPTNNPLDYAEYSRQRTGNGFAAAQGVPGAQDNVQTPQYAAMEAEAAASDYYSGDDVLDYLVSSLQEQVVKDGFVIEKATAAILIDAGSLQDGERDAIIALAANASGIAPENITVQNLKFPENPIDIKPTPPNTMYFVIGGLGLLLFCIIMIIALTMVSRRRKRLAEEAAAAAANALQYDENGVPLIDLMNQDIDYEPIALAETSEQKLKMQIKDLAESDPEIVAQLIKTWLVSSK